MNRLEEVLAEARQRSNEKATNVDIESARAVMHLLRTEPEALGLRTPAGCLQDADGDWVVSFDGHLWQHAHLYALPKEGEEGT